MKCRLNYPSLKLIVLISMLAVAPSVDAVWAQQQKLDSLVKKFSKHAEADFTEKLFAHTDRTSYLTGETLWFKLYCINAVDSRLSDVSKVAYVEILSSDGNRVLDAKVRISDGMGDGSFFLPATLQSGNYILRAYTAWMKNKTPELFFQQNITIINSFRSSHTTANKANKKIDARFLPEGGNLVMNVQSKVAFRITDEFGKGIDCRGWIFNDQQDTITRFSTGRFGIGTLQLTPKKDEKYSAVIEFEGTKTMSPLPDALPMGFTLSATGADKSVDINVTSTVTDLTSPFIYLFVHANNKIVHAETKFINNGSARFIIPRSKFPEGISHITLFDPDLNPVAERLFYTTVKKNPSIDAITGVRQYNTRSKGTLTISIANAINLQANLSVSIYKKDSLSIFARQEIVSYLKLASDLTGIIESPDYYITNGTDVLFDNLMLTHGWRKFSWKNILSGNTTKPANIPELQGLIVKGMVTDKNGKPAWNVKTHLSTASKSTRLYSSISRKNGEVMYLVPDLIGKHKIYIQTGTSRDSSYNFSLETPFVLASPSITLPNLKLRKAQSNAILARSVSMQVQDIFAPEIKEDSGISDSTSFFGSADEIYYLDDYTRFPVMEEVMREYVKGVMVRKRQGNFHFKVLDNINKLVFNEDPLILLDGVPVTDTDKIMQFDPRKVKKIEIMTRQFFHGRHAYAGIVSYTTYTGDMAGFEQSENTITLDYDGLQAQRIFYAPTYLTNEQRSNRLPDQRHLLLWKPDAFISGENAEIEFYTSDVEGDYEISVQGVTSNGVPISASGSFKVSGFDN